VPGTVGDVQRAAVGCGHHHPAPPLLAGPLQLHLLQLPRRVPRHPLEHLRRHGGALLLLEHRHGARHPRRLAGGRGRLHRHLLHHLDVVLHAVGGHGGLDCSYLLHSPHLLILLFLFLLLIFPFLLLHLFIDLEGKVLETVGFVGLSVPGPEAGLPLPNDVPVLLHQVQRQGGRVRRLKVAVGTRFEGELRPQVDFFHLLFISFLLLVIQVSSAEADRLTLLHVLDLPHLLLLLLTHFLSILHLLLDRLSILNLFLDLILLQLHLVRIEELQHPIIVLLLPLHHSIVLIHLLPVLLLEGGPLL